MTSLHPLAFLDMEELTAEELQLDTLLSRSEIAYDPNGPIVVFSPHPADAVLNCWSVLNRSEEDVVVVNIFADLPAPGILTRYDAVNGAIDSATYMEERIAEDRRVLWPLIEREPYNLPFLEQQYRQQDPAIEQIEYYVRLHVPTASRIIAPAAIGGHPDHLLTRLLAIRCCNALDALTIPLTFVADIPYCVRFGWPSWVTGKETALLAPEADWEYFLQSLPMWPVGMRPVPVRLEDRAEDKLQCMQKYKRIWPGLNGGCLGILSHPDIYPYEAGWHLQLPSVAIDLADNAG